MTLKEKFLKYVSFETTSYEIKEDNCSDEKEWNLSSYLFSEIQKLNPKELSINRFGIIDAKFDGTNSEDRVAFLAHMDTSSASSGKDIKPKSILFNGEDIELKPGMKLSIEEYPALKKSIGHELIVTDGNTLLGGDDKAGIAIIMESLERVLKEDHRPLEIIFTTDEEIGVDAHHISMEDVTAKYGYTVDGGDCDTVSIESFTAYAMDVLVSGKSIHPGSAKDKLINSIDVLYEFDHSLPLLLRPQETTDKEPFYLLDEIKGSVEETKASYIIRSFDSDQMDKMIELAKFSAKRINEKLGYEAIKLDIKNQYNNMKSVLDTLPQIQKEMERIYSKNGITCQYEAIRGGTTGSSLSFMGLPCPNLGDGDFNCHGRSEYVDVNQMEKMVDIVSDLMR